jgi:regulator of sigma E protease
LRVARADPGAAAAGLAGGDLLYQVNGQRVKDLPSLSAALASGGAEATVAVVRGGQPVLLHVARVRGRGGGWGLGAAYTTEPELRRLDGGQAWVHAVATPWAAAASMSTRAVAAVLATSAKERPLGIVALADRVHAARGWTWPRALSLALSLSVAMGLFNLLPFPGLDGGRLCIEGAQALCRRQLPRRWLVGVQVTGGLLLLAGWIALAAHEIRLL